MSYTRRYSESVSKTVSISYPKSESGGSKSVTVEIPVDVNIHVDTSPFDTSVNHCDANVDLLTAAVVATEAAEIETKRENSKKVADSVIGGFFKYIRYEISQQVAELSQNIDAQLMHLKELAQSCKAKKEQMEVDYNRISGRYVKISDDLNKEISNRINELDKPAFAFKKETDNQKIRTSDNDLVNTVAIFGAESSDLQSKISTSIAKKRAFDSIIKAKAYLMQQKKLNNTISQSMINESISSSIFAPVCFVETKNAGNQMDKSVFNTDYLSKLKDKKYKNELIDKFQTKSMNWDKIKPDDQRNLILYFNTELNTKSHSNDQHSVRVREMIQKIADISSINAINY